MTGALPTTTTVTTASCRLTATTTATAPTMLLGSLLSTEYPQRITRVSAMAETGIRVLRRRSWLVSERHQRCTRRQSSHLRGPTAKRLILATSPLSLPSTATGQSRFRSTTTTRPETPTRGPVHQVNEASRSMCTSPRS